MAIIFNGRADAGATKATYTWQEEYRVGTNDDSIRIVPCPDGQGDVFRFSSKPTDGYINGDYRAELSTHIATPLSEEWYFQEVFLPTDGVPLGIIRGILTQWHSVDSGAESYGRQPPIDFNIELHDRITISTRYDANVTSIQSPNSVTTVVHGKYPIYGLLNRRVPIVVHAKWDWGNFGLFEVWIDHYPIISKIGSISFNDAQGPYIKLGIAHVSHGFQGEEVYVYNTGAKIGDSASSYLEMTGREPYKGTLYKRGVIN